MKTKWQAGDKLRLLDVSQIECGVLRKNGDVLTVIGVYSDGTPYTGCGLVFESSELPFIEKVTEEATTKTTTGSERTMTNKLTVTLGQSIALGMYIKENGSSMRSFVLNRHNWRNRYAPIKDLTMDEMTTAMYVGYEQEVTERGFEVGDWVTPARDGNYLDTHQDIKVAKVSEADSYYLRLDGPSGSFTADYLRLATPNEIFWAELGRGTNELRYGDVIIHSDKSIYLIAEDDYHMDDISMEDAGIMLGNEEITKLFPAESALDMPEAD